MKLKTISGHYGKAYNLAHNNRTFIPHNVDPERVRWNYSCVEAGAPALLSQDQPRDYREFWTRYRELSELYWTDRDIHVTLAREKYLENLKYMRRHLPQPVCDFQ